MLTIELCELTIELSCVSRLDFDRCAQVFQRRLDGSVDFYRDWVDYKNGFGSTSGEFWLGNDNIHSLTNNGNHILRIDMETFDRETKFAKYVGFSIDAESTNYALRLVAYLVSSTAGEWLYRFIRVNRRIIAYRP